MVSVSFGKQAAHLTAYEVISPNHCRPNILLLRKDSHILLRSRLGIITQVVLLTCSLFLSFPGDLSSPDIFNKTDQDKCTVSPRNTVIKHHRTNL